MPPKSLAQVSKESSTALFFRSFTEEGLARRERRELEDAFNFDDVHPPPTPKPAPLRRSGSTLRSIVLSKRAASRTFSPLPPSREETQPFWREAFPRDRCCSPEPPLQPSSSSSLSGHLPSSSGSSPSNFHAPPPPAQPIPHVDNQDIFTSTVILKIRMGKRRTCNGVEKRPRAPQNNKPQTKLKLARNIQQSDGLLQQAMDAGIVTVTVERRREMTAAEIADRFFEEYIQYPEDDSEDN
ncbi:hypothetical protein NMY22_g15525 [Coprinellus aureogranulatus]|nr:hypothetical protein NMY22_g15525 [Coprinellus aureogranulatus]